MLALNNPNALAKVVPAFISENDFTHLASWREEASRLQKNPFLYALSGKLRTLGLIFLQPDLHARLALQKAAHTLGMNIQEIYLRTHGTEVEMGHRPGTLFADTEHLRQTAQALGQYCDVLAVYAPAQLQDAEQDYADTLLHYLRLYAQIPVFNLESALHHPWQALADWLTIEAFKKMEKPRVVLQWVPYDRPVSAARANSLVGLLRKADVDVTVSHPPNHRLHENFMGGIKSFYHPEKALVEADFVIALNWCSTKNYGQAENKNPRWRLTQDKMTLTRKAFLLHQHPVWQGIGIEPALLENERCLLGAQAANRVIAAQLILKELLATLQYGQ